MSKVLAAFLALGLAACASLPDNRPFSQDEIDVMTAALREDVSSAETKGRPTVLADRTDTWLPQPDSLNELKPELFGSEATSIVQALRLANRRASQLPKSFVPAGVQMRSAKELDRAFRSVPALDAWAKQFPKEPMVLWVSRPVFSRDGSLAVVTETLESTWSGCGGYQILIFRRVSGAWEQADWGFLQVW